MNRDNVVLVDHFDKPLGIIDKLEAHKLGRLHRAFSVFIFNNNGEMLLQQRALNKYHGAGLWTNTCCSHPQWSENIKSSALERLNFEMGINCDLDHLFTFEYRAEVENRLIEHEIDHVFIGQSDVDPVLNDDEVNDYIWLPFDYIENDIKLRPHIYTVWFKQALPQVIEMMRLNNQLVV